MQSTKRPWQAVFTPAIGKVIRKLASLRGGGTALPGKIIEQYDPSFLARSLAQLPYGVVLVSGTNGKTTTTRMVASVFEQCGLKVFTNPTGSNFTRGVVSALLGAVDMRGRLDADIAVLELDEAYAVHFVKQVHPWAALLLNVMRDQLDRFGEIDHTAQLLGKVAAATDGVVVLNREDPRIRALAHDVPAGTSVRYFGLAPTLREQFPTDDAMQTTVSVQQGSVQEVNEADTQPEHTKTYEAQTDNAHVIDKQTGNERTEDAQTEDAQIPAADVLLTQVCTHQATYQFGDQQYATPMRLEGLYNLYNAAAALAVVHAVQPELSPETLIQAIAQVTPAFGRGETIDYHGTPIELVLVKNPMGFRLALASFDPSHTATMIAINDEYADGRDMSWLWDVDFTSLRKQGVAMVSGVRAWDMALRLQYDQVAVEHVDTELTAAVDQFCDSDSETPKRIYCTYTAMLAIRSHLAHKTHVDDVGLK